MNNGRGAVWAGDRLGARAIIGHALGQLTAALERQEPEEIEAASCMLSDVLERFDQDFLV